MKRRRVYVVLTRCLRMTRAMDTRVGIRRFRGIASSSHWFPIPVVTRRLLAYFAAMIRARSLSSVFGPLEIRVLEALWSRRGEGSVRDLLDGFPGVAYTTLMTTLDRLYKKRVLTRRRFGRGFRYAPATSREELEASLAAEALDAVVASLSSPAALRPLVTSFVDAVSFRDELALDELEEAVRARRRALRRGEETR
jgi:predicted transcriptional regulator